MRASVTIFVCAWVCGGGGACVLVQVCECVLACIEKGVFLSISMHLLQIVSIYLFIFFPEEKKKCARGCVCGCVCVHARVLTCVFYTADFKPRQ